jgi:hypothetical protein
MFHHSQKEGISSKAAEFYASGLSLRESLSLSQISGHLKKSKSFIRKTISHDGVSHQNIRLYD